LKGLYKYVKRVNPRAIIIDAASPIFVEDPAVIEGRRVLVIEDGQVTEEGTHRELLRAGGRYAMMYEEFIRSE